MYEEITKEVRSSKHISVIVLITKENKVEVSIEDNGEGMFVTLAVARLYLDNFDHITAYWVGMGMKLAQVALNYGADDLHGTILEEKIFHMAGADTPQLQTETEMIQAIREAGRVPVQRDTVYEPSREWTGEEALAKA